MFQSHFTKKICLTAALLGFLAVGCSAKNPDAATTTPEQTATAPSDANPELLVGNWKMQMVGLQELDGLSDAEKQEFERMMEEMSFLMVFTEDGKVKSSMDDEVSDYAIKGNQVIVNGDALTFSVDETKLTLKGPEQVLTFTRTDKGLDDFSQNAFASTARLAKEAEGKTYAGSMNRAQQAYRLEESTFATNLADLGLGIEPETDLYRYSTQATEQVSFNHAVAKQDNLRSVVGGVWVVSEGEDSFTKSLLCVADAPGTEQLADPNIDGDNMSCPAGSSMVQ